VVVRGPRTPSIIGVAPMSIVERMLNNLKAIYLRNGDLARLRGVMSLRAAFPGLGRAESDEFRRLMAPFN